MVWGRSENRKPGSCVILKFSECFFFFFFYCCLTFFPSSAGVSFEEAIKQVKAKLDPEVGGFLSIYMTLSLGTSLRSEKDTGLSINP